MWVAFLALGALGQSDHTAVFITAKKGTPVTLVDAVRQSTGRAAVTALKDGVVSDAAIAAIVKTPEKQLEKCGANLRCITRIGAKVGATKVLYGRVVPNGKDGVQVQLLLIGVASKLIEQRGMIELRSLDEVRAKLVDQVYSLLAISGPGHIEISGVTAEVSIDGKVVGNAPGDFTVSPGRHDVLVLGVSASVLVLPGGYERLNITPPPIIVAPASQPASQAVESVPVDTSVALVVPAKKRGLTWMTPTGIGIAAAGAVGVGIGVYFGVQSNRQNSQIVPGTSSQIDASRLQREANANAVAANICYAVGGAALGAGIGLLVADLILSQRTIAPVITLLPGGAYGGVSAAF